MKKLAKIIFYYQDGTSDKIDDARAAIVFQSRFNSSGILSGLEDAIVPNEDQQETVA
jgi:hypothetical protein